MSRLTHSVRSPGGWKRRPNRRASTRPPPQPRLRQSSRHIRFYLLSSLFSRRLLTRLLVFSIIAIVSGATFLTFAIATLSHNLPELGRLIDRSVPISTKIYDREGKVLLYDIHGEAKRTPISLDQIAPLAIKAALVAEDRDFYAHPGFDIRGMLRSLFLDIFAGGPLRGGSTITQQFIKNAVLSREKTLSRKLKELMLAYKIEKRFSKDEILNMYFNEIPYGSTIYGIEAASQTFFGKSAKDLDLVEGAILAALPKAPSRLSPHGNHTDELIARVRYILSGLVEEGYINRKEADSAAKEDPLARVKLKKETILAPHFVLYVRDQLVDKYGEEFIEQGGLKVITTLDWRLQQIAEEEIKKGAEYNEKQYQGKNAALVAQDPKTGQILAMVGSRDYFDETVDGNVNVALRARQPGSSFKPIVYGAAFAKGFTPDTLLWDVVTTFKVEPKDYTPHNYDNKEHGLVSIRQALAGSLNIPAVKTIYLTGIGRVLDLADKLGYTTLTDRSRFGLSLVLGGGEVKLVEHVGAFAAFANDGKHTPQSALLRIEDSSGRVLEEWEAPRVKQVVDPAVVRELISVLSDNAARAFIFGSNSPLILKDRPVAAKTGTTNDWRDGWTLGFTPSLAAGVWAGNNDNAEMKRGSDGVLVAAPIWNAFMSRALNKTPAEQFPPLLPRTIFNPLLRGQGIAQPITVKVNRTNGKIATSSTPRDLIEERVYGAPHSELYYFNKDDLSAPSPAEASTDPSFQNFEDALRRYGEEHNFRGEPPPTEYDTTSTTSTP
ncbi:hypothetical protein A3B21_05415 [Candidatus Uhrbacteria bacterium RIFCSPLOWO2_01_FULL_47_24]|uniref:Uncharacterized protein n=1 Tax=Candidatus Uhrbacteria bacterium RIFCSPLOWO2_01_FULL_47_24 TaxID=1802401 RepID=A0A1F7UWV3_9BACT|nr:MAG: hypothetical protein A2753_01265 [Candidatus Uhrbacteria bacterium RIFCSPHIGHO2_01_FULL_47_11]OGL67507.1 MAG: hypothetical protein A3D58_01640 [Candidatus Uhrbacteria bacterium RIFCSPHIGHO2_02_FULL_46_47]OGL76527.1 MAG: hypothetical protein A3F52_02800 [Candidatus Uhrbacteria bacterium RIFCSPHIGHO2_12_FULL_47_11]OGL82117.1 MAG: hypothetical protein A3B21_05415 [Candidatus Uhrbacteria bacterium RIFCSPLOWO2_01_FULL_47_24]